MYDAGRVNRADLLRELKRAQQDGERILREYDSASLERWTARTDALVGTYNPNSAVEFRSPAGPATDELGVWELHKKRLSLVQQIMSRLEVEAEAAMSELTAGQFKLLRGIVEVSSQIPESKTKEFLIIETFGSPASLLFEVGNERIKGVGVSDVHELESRNLLRRTRFNSRGTPLYSVTNEGIKFVSSLPSVPKIAEETISWVKKELPPGYEAAQGLIEEALQKLATAKSEFDFSEIGHKCREALQEFSEVLYNRHGNPDKKPEKKKDQAKIGMVLTAWKPVIGGTYVNMLDALTGYWASVSDHVQKVEHRSEKEARPLTHEDAKRAVFYSYLVMAEIALIEPPSAG